MEKLAEWVILELMGHRVLAGRAREVERYGTKLCQIEVPLGEKPPEGQAENFFVQRYGGGAVYCETPVTEDVARDKARFYHPAKPAALLGAGTSTPEKPPKVSPAWEDEQPDWPEEELPPARPTPMYQCDELDCTFTADSPEAAQAHADQTEHLLSRLRGEGPLITPRQLLDESADPVIEVVVDPELVRRIGGTQAAVPTPTTGADDPIEF